MPMFPDSGVVPSEAKNSLPDVNTACPSGELWYSTSRCQPRFDPAAANAMLAEDMNLIMKGELQYDCARLDHIERAVRYINQRGLPRGAVLYGGPADYTFGLDPVMTRYNDYMTLTVIPGAENQAAVRINGNNLGWVNLLRNDATPLQAKDIRAGVPFIMAYWAGNWWHVGLCASQIPPPTVILSGTVDIWIRTDGNDATGDGSANDPSKAFQTIQGAWYAVGGRYLATPTMVMNMKLGIPGTYAGAILGPFGGQITLQGAGGGTRGDYRLSSIYFGNNIYGNLLGTGVRLNLINLTLVRDTGPPWINVALASAQNSSVTLNDCDFDSTAGNPQGFYMTMADSGVIGFNAGTFTFHGQGLQAHSIMKMMSGGTFNSCYSILRNNLVFSNCPLTYGIWAEGLSVASFAYSNVSESCSGPEYLVTQNSIIDMAGQPCPGSTNGTMQSGGRFIP